MTCLVANNALGVLAAGISSVATSFALETGQGALFPSPNASAGEYALVTLIDDNSNAEIVKYTARSGDNFSGVTRGQDGTTGLTFATGSSVQLRIVAAHVRADAILPDQSAHGGQELATDGNLVSWTGRIFTQCRIYLTSGQPVSHVSSGSGFVRGGTPSSHLYFGPYNGDQVTVLDADDNPHTYPVSEISVTPSLAANKVYDVFAYCVAGTWHLVFSTAWTDFFNRVDAVVQARGLWVLSSDHTRLHVGTVATDSAGTLVDNPDRRFVWNRYNQLRNFLYYEPYDALWQTLNQTIHQSGVTFASTLPYVNEGNQVEYVTGDDGTMVYAEIAGQFQHATPGSCLYAGIGVNTYLTFTGPRSDNYAQVANVYTPLRARYAGVPGLGRHYLSWNEQAGSVATDFTVLGQGTSVFGFIDN